MTGWLVFLGWVTISTIVGRALLRIILARPVCTLHHEGWFTGRCLVHSGYDLPRKTVPLGQAVDRPLMFAFLAAIAGLAWPRNSVRRLPRWSGGFTMVNTENMQKWIDALRSGEYTKITGNLERFSGNCAEGVACREAIKAGVQVRVRVTGSGHTAFNDEDTRAPREVLAWLGLGLVDRPMVGDHSVIDLNDITDQTFDDIADGLYEQYLKEPKTDG